MSRVVSLVSPIHEEISRDRIAGRLGREDERQTQYCQFEIGDADLPAEYGGWCCLRETWDDCDHCIWHADVRGKPVDELASALRPERLADLEYRPRLLRLDGAKLSHLEIETTDPDPDQPPTGPSISFSDCRLIGADFRYSTLRGTSFDSAIAIDADFKQADLTYRLLQSGDFSGASFRYATMTGVHTHHTSFVGTDLVGADLSDANLVFSDCRDADFRHADLTDTHLHDANLSGANLEDVTLERTDLTDADLSQGCLHKAIVRDVRIDEGTEFGRICWYERQADGSDENTDRSDAGDWLDVRSTIQPLARFWRRLRGDSAIDESSDLMKAIRVYRLYQRVHRQNSLPEPARRFRIRERHARRKHALATGQYLTWLNLAQQRWTTLYGESPKRVVSISLFGICLFALLYPLFGIQTDGHTVTYWTTSILKSLRSSLYLSATAFANTGYHASEPLDLGRGLAALESLFGALALALFVFVLGRRSAW